MTHSNGNVFLLKTFFRLTRWPNLMIMLLTLALVRYGVIYPLYQQSGLQLQLPSWQFMLLMLSTVMIGAGGYIINDILDAGLDQVNKPAGTFVGSSITEKTAMNWYYVTNAIGVGSGLALSYFSDKIEMGILFIIIATALYYYSLKYKYLAFWGNFTVALLSAIVVLIVWLFEFFHLKSNADAFATAIPVFSQLIRFVLGYALFAFLVSFNRELVKDTEDMEGDRRYGCNTIPIAIGLKKARLISAMLTLVTVAGLALIQVLLARSIYLPLVLSLLVVQLLLVIIFLKTLGAREPSAFRPISQLLKWAMLAGVLSMVFLLVSRL